MRTTVILVAFAAAAISGASRADAQSETSGQVAARLSKIVDANKIATHAYQLGMPDAKKADAACWSACGLSAEELKALVLHQAALLAEKPAAVKAWAEGQASEFDPSKDLDPILKSPLQVAAAGLPVNVYTEYFRAKTAASPLSCRALASVLQMMLEVDRDANTLQQMYALYVVLGLPVHTAKLGMPEKTDEEFLAVAQQLSPKMCVSPVDVSPLALRMMFRKMWNWGHRYTGERDRRVVAAELLQQPEIQAILPQIRAMPAQKIAVIGHSYTMEVHWASPSAFVPLASEVLKQTNSKVEVRQWQAGGMNASRPDCRRFYQEALAWRPDRVLFVVAAHTPADAAALGEMVDGFAKIGAKVMMFDMLHPGNVRVGPPIKVLQDLAAGHGLELIEVGPLLAASPDRGRFVCLDEIHMTEPYHRLMATQWLKYLAGARTAKITDK